MIWQENLYSEPCATGVGWKRLRCFLCDHFKFPATHQYGLGSGFMSVSPPPQVLRTPVFQGITPWLHHPLFFSSMIYIDLWVSCFRVFPRCFGESLCETLPGSNVLGFWRCLSGLGADKNCPENRWQIPNDSEPHPGGIVMHCRCMDVISIHVFSGWIGEMLTWYNMII